MRRFFLIAIPYVWLLALFLVPFAIVLKISLSDAAMARPPYFPQFEGWAEGIRTFMCRAGFRELCLADRR